jgi:Reverse transcriptase (RNA-dependent DNA polymerase)
LNLLAEMMEVNFLVINDGIAVSEEIIQSNGVRQGGCLSPFLFIYALSDLNEILNDLKTVSLILYADDIVLYGDDLDELKIALRRVSDYLEKRKLKLNIGKCKMMKFTKKGKGRKRDDDVVYIDGEKVEFMPEFCYLGVTFQASGNTFTKHVDKRVRAAIFSISRLKSLNKTSVETALKLFDLAVSPVASYGIEAIWPYLSKNDLNNLEKAKSRFLKRVLSMDKTLRSRFTYELAETDLFVNDLKCKYNLSDTTAYDEFMEQKIVNFSQIDPDFYETPAFSDAKWKNVNFKDRHLLTRYACHGFHHKICKRKDYHIEANDKC